MKATIHSITLFLLLLGYTAVGQVTKVKYILKYNPTSCVYDCYIKVTAGSTTNPLSRTQFNSQYSLVVPLFSQVTVVQNYNPLQGNSTGTCTNCAPLVWTPSSIVNDTFNSQKTYVSIVPTLSPTSFYNPLTTNQEVKLFSVSITPSTSKCGQDVKLYENGVDPSSSAPGMGGGDFSQGFLIGNNNGPGNPVQDYDGNLPQVYPPQPVLVANQVCVDNAIQIDLTATSSACMSPHTYSWTGPGGYSSTSQDVNISNAVYATHGGNYQVTVTDAIGCKDTLNIDAFPPPNAGNDIDLCGPNSSVTLTGTDPTSGSWSASTNNNQSGYAMGTTSGGVVDVNFNAGVYGSYNFIYSAHNCADSLTVLYNLADAGADPAQVLCFSNGLATLNAVGTGTWSFAPGNPGSATISNPNSASTDVTGFTAAGTYTLIWTVGACTNEVQIVVGNQCSGCLIANNNITLPSLDALCQSSGTFNIQGSTATPSGGTYLWQYSVNGGAYTNAPGTNNQEDYTVSNWGPATYEVKRLYTVTGANACTDESSPVSFEVISNPAAPVNLVANPNPVCLGSTVNLSVTNNPGSTYSWSVSNAANAGLVSNTVNIATLTPLAAGSYTVSVTRSTGACESLPATISVIAVETPLTPTNITPTNPTACGGTNGSIAISGLTASTTYTVNYKKNSLSQTATLSTNGSGILTISNLTSGTYTDFSLTLSGCTSGTNAGPFVLTDPNAPPIPSNISASDNVICENSTTSISVTNNPGATYAWSSSNPAILAPQTPSTTNSITMVGLAPGTVIVSVTQNVGGCISPAATIQITVNDSPNTPTFATTTTSNPTTCSGTDGSITFSGYLSNSAYSITYVVNGNTNTVNITSNGSGLITITGLTAGSYSGFVVNNAADCPSNTFNGPILLSDPGNVSPSNFVATPNPVCLGYSVNLSVQNIPNAVYTWSASSSAAGLNSSSSSNTVMIPTSAGVYSISVTQTVAGCTSPPAVATILVRDDCYNPDFGVTFVNVELSGNLNTNDDAASGSEYDGAVAWPGNPAACFPNISSDGIYTFTCSTPGEYNYYVPVCLDESCKNVPLTITVLQEMSINNPPVANHDYINTKANTAVYINITANDKCQSVPNCTFGTPQVITAPQHGTYNANTGIYSPANGFSGVDSFLYRVCQTPTNTSSNCDEEWVYIIVFPSYASNFTNGMDDFGQTPLNTPLVASVGSGAKANDVDVEGHTTSINPINTSVLGKGSISLAANGSYTFTPASNFVGPVDFAYQICDSGNPTACDSATLHILVESQLPTGNLGDFVWHDVNGNGVQNPGEPGIANVTVKLYNDLGVLINTTTTNGSGFYQFLTVTVGNYYLEFAPADTAYDATFSGRGTVSTDSDITGINGYNTTNTFYLSAGETNNTYDAGFYKCVGIGDVVWYDTNKNDVQNPTENGINGITVKLYRNHFGTWVLWDQMKTGHKPGTPSDDGYYRFCAAPGAYYIQVVSPPSGLVRARPFIGGNTALDSDLNNANGLNTSNVINLSSGQNNYTIDGGFYPQATVGNLVWMDDNVNGIQDASEEIVSNVLVEAFEVSSNILMSSAITDENGFYTLGQLNQAEVYLKFTPPSGYSATIAGQGSDEVNSDVDHSFGLNTTRSFSIQSGKSNPNIDMGIAAGALPLRWLSVGVKATSKTHLVTWSTTAEVNTDYFVVERKLQGEKQFTDISGKIPATSIATLKNHYQFNDSDIDLSGLYEYRIRQVDLDGRYDHSDIVDIRVEEKGSIEIFPNPTVKYANINIESERDGEIGIIIADITGKLVGDMNRNYIIQKGNNTIPLDLGSLMSGVYNITITIDNSTITKTIIKN